MPVLYENYITGDDGNANIFGVNWDGQTFTPSAAHTVTSVKLLLSKVGSPGTLTVSIRVTSANLPSEGDLASGTIDGNAISGTEWKEITLGAGTPLSASTKYAICIRATSGNGSNYVNARRDGSSPTYAGGNRVYSSDSGSSWNTSAHDMLFEEWGDIIGGSTVTTEECTNTIATSTKGWGHITVVGDGAPTQHGHVWSTSQEPTTSDSKTELGAKPQTGNFTSSIIGLTPGTTYYVKAYAINTAGTNYGSQVSITTLTTIGKRHWWVEGKEFHYWDENGAERKFEGVPDTSGLPWWYYL